MHYIRKDDSEFQIHYKQGYIPCHIQRRHGLLVHAYVSVFAWLSYLETSLCNPKTKQVQTNKVKTVLCTPPVRSGHNSFNTLFCSPLQHSSRIRFAMKSFLLYADKLLFLLLLPLSSSLVSSCKTYKPFLTKQGFRYDSALNISFK